MQRLNCWKHYYYFTSAVSLIFVRGLSVPPGPNSSTELFACLSTMGATGGLFSDDDQEKLVTGIRDMVVGELRSQIEKVMKELIDDFHKQLFREFSEIRLSISSLQSSVAVNNNKIQNDVIAIVSRIDEIESVASSRVTEVSKNVDAIALRVEKLTSLVPNMSAKSSNCSIAGPGMDECLNEFEDRLSRKRNVVVFGIPESKSDDARQRMRDDVDYLGRVFTELSFDEPTGEVSCSRLGKYSPNLAHPRPVKLVLVSPDKANSLIRSAHRNKNRAAASALLKRIRIRPDKTNHQRQQWNRLWTELVARKKIDKNQHMKIVTMNGVAKIVVSPHRLKVWPQ